MGSRLLDAVERSVGVYGTSPTFHLSALARVPGVTLDELEAARETDRSLVSVRAMRYSVYAFPHELLTVALAATRRERLEGVLRRASDIEEVYPDLSAAVETALADGPLPSADIRRHVDPDRELEWRFSLLLARMAAEARIVRATRTGSWRSNRYTWARWEDWIPDVDPRAVDAEEARRDLARRYVAAYGPVTVDDLAWWTGWTRALAREAVDGLDLEAEGDAVALLDGVRLLPVWDVFMVAYRHRERLLDPEHHRFVYDSMGNATSVVLDGGRVVGVWDLGGEDDPLEITTAPLGSWPGRRWDDVEEQARRIGDMIGAATVEIERADAPVDLTEAPRNTFKSPLSG